MKSPPAYFELARQEAAQQWQQLEQNPKLAGPWRLLFKQVCQPRHVLSELLQNADDAGATKAAARVDGDTFLFEHNGADFQAADFASLCMFCHSSKRALHTIGFRGIGFKSTFSLGDRVELHTPTLAVRFESARFTEPVWVDDADDVGALTQIRIPLKNAQLRSLIDQDFDRWLASPISLLFLRHVRSVEIGGRLLHWRSLGSGPVGDSEWMTSDQSREAKFLAIRSHPEPFPQDALQEIREERMLSEDETAGFPPCAVELVLGGEGALFAVLPTGIATGLPFACNAPFMQDPARHGIKDPRVSPVNRWLLERIGRLAGAAFLGWLSRTDLEEAERARAYALLPAAGTKNSALGGLCGSLVQRAMTEAIEGQRLLLAEGGDVHPAHACVVVPSELLDVWPRGQAAVLLDEKGRPPLSRYVAPSDRDRLIRWRLVDGIDKNDLLSALQCRYLPRPQSWERLALLWAYIAPDITGFGHSYEGHVNQLRIVPVHGKDELQAASKVVRLGEKKLLQAEGDWEFLSEYLLVADPAWLRFLEKPKHPDSKAAAEDRGSATQAASAVLRELELDNASDVSEIINRVAAELLDQDEVSLKDSVRLAQIAAKLKVAAGDGFLFATRDGARRGRSRVLFDADGELEVLLPESMRADLLHSAYTARFTSCTKAEWQQWVESGKSGLGTFLPLEEKRCEMYGRQRITKEAKRRGYDGELEFRGASQRFAIEDWDYNEAAWSHWQSLAAEDDRVWERVGRRILGQRESYWRRAGSARFVQQLTRSEGAISSGPVLPNWVLRLRDAPCLPDSRGFPRRPTELLRLTTETESLLDVEVFVHRSLDTEASRPLLDLLGVGSAATGPDRLLSRLRALAGAREAPASEVEKWYRRLDLLITTGSTSVLNAVRKAFRTEKLILTNDGNWVAAAEVFLGADEEAVPDAPLIRPDARDLALWQKVGVADRPTAELAMEWLHSLESGTLAPDHLRRVRGLLARYPARVWTECEHWLSLAGEWTPTADLKWALTKPSRMPTEHLFSWAKQETADFRPLPADAVTEPPFAGLPTLASQIEERIEAGDLLAAVDGAEMWMTILGLLLKRVDLGDEEKTAVVRCRAADLEATRWRRVSDLTLTPYINGTPAGTSRRADVVWLGHTLFVTDLPRAKLAKRVPEEISRPFGRSDFEAALNYCFGRSPRDVTEYLEENFTLVPEEPRDDLVDEEKASPAASNERILPPDASPAETAVGIPASSAGATRDETQGRTEQSAVAEPGGAVPSSDAARPAELTPNPAGSLEVVQVDARGETATVQLQAVSPAPSPRNATIRESAEPGAPTETEGTGIGLTARDSAEPHTVKPTLIERLAAAQGFQRDGDGRFVRQDGVWIGRSHGERFPWQRRTASGDLVRYYWTLDRCLERQPLEIEYDVWQMMERQPETHALVLEGADGEAVELTGTRLCEMRERGEITLHPATYRVVYGHARDS